MKGGALIIAFVIIAGTVESQNFERIPVETMMQFPPGISFREIAVGSSGDVVITTSNGFVALVGSQWNIMNAKRRASRKNDNPLSMGHSNILKDYFELHTGYKSISAGPGDIFYAVSDNNDIGVMNLSKGIDFMVPPFIFPNNININKVWIDKIGDLFISARDSFYMIRYASNILAADGKTLIYEPVLGEDSNIVIKKGAKEIKGFSLGKGIIATCFGQLTRSSIIIGTSQGLYQFDTETTQIVDLFAKTGEESVAVSCISVPEKGSVIWFGTPGKGLGAYNRLSGKVVYYPVQENVSNAISDLTRLSKKELLVAINDSLPAIFNTDALKYEFIQDTNFGHGRKSTSCVRLGSEKRMVVLLGGELFIGKNNLNPPAWKTGWFWVIMILSLAAVFYGMGIWRVNISRKKEREKLSQEKKVFELEARALRAQMNPHFIFNCLNSIKALIQNDEKQKSMDYLTTFSKLIRTSFHNSDKRQITLFDEIETCRLYTELEAFRLEDKILWSFNISYDLDLKSVMVPALIVQPFIENAIWHGIVPKGKGCVDVKVYGNEDIISCEIDDDGIGREVSKNNKPATPVMHQSKGINLSQARLDLERLLGEKSASIQIIDKYEEGIATGTKVIIQFNLH